jgi:gluconate 2-dehydrogenase gamma chain
MASYSTDRRSVLRILGTIGATCAYPYSSENLHGQTVDQHQHHALPEQPAQPRFFNDQDFATISRITDLIIPETETPGAVKAGVPAYLDLVIARDTDHQLVVADGLRWLDRVAGKHFIELSEEQQLEILEPLCEASDADPNSKARNVQFFALVKSLTADGYYTSKIGLIDELGYKGDNVRPSYPTCST